MTSPPKNVAFPPGEVDREIDMRIPNRDDFFIKISGNS